MAGENKSYLFLDESGDHSLDVIDDSYPVFVLGGVLIKSEEYADIEKKWKKMKESLWGNAEIVLHTADMSRNRNGFERMKEPSFRETVYNTLNRVMSELPYQVLCCAIKKGEHVEKYAIEAIDPYHLSLHIIVERAFFAMGKKGNLHIIAESRNPLLDRILETVFLELKIKGTQYLSAPEVNTLNMELHIRDKKKNIAGLQMADLIVTPVGRYVMGKAMHKDWDVINSKFYRYRGKREGAGLVQLPK